MKWGGGQGPHGAPVTPEDQQPVLLQPVAEPEGELDQRPGAGTGPQRIRLLPKGSPPPEMIRLPRPLSSIRCIAPTAPILQRSTYLMTPSMGCGKATNERLPPPPCPPCPLAPQRQDHVGEAALGLQRGRGVHGLAMRRALGAEVAGGAQTQHSMQVIIGQVATPVGRGQRGSDSAPFRGRTPYRALCQRQPRTGRPRRGQTPGT